MLLRRSRTERIILDRLFCAELSSHTPHAAVKQMVHATP
jgi:hypothetical protein